LHIWLPLSSWYFPAAQSVQVALPYSEYRPMAQSVQLVVPVLAAYLPASQPLQSQAELLPDVTKNFPTSHAAQAALPLSSA